jgi:hypothetical protein
MHRRPEDSLLAGRSDRLTVLAKGEAASYASRAATITRSACRALHAPISSGWPSRWPPTSALPALDCFAGPFAFGKPGSITGAVFQFRRARSCSPGRLTDVKRARAALPDLVGITHLHRQRCDETESCTWSKPGPTQDPAHSPCSPPHARLAGHITAARWWALTPPFHPSP